MIIISLIQKWWSLCPRLRELQIISNRLSRGNGGQYFVATFAKSEKKIPTRIEAARVLQQNMP